MGESRGEAEMKASPLRVTQGGGSTRGGLRGPYKEECPLTKRLPKETEKKRNDNY